MTDTPRDNPVPSGRSVGARGIAARDRRIGGQHSATYHLGGLVGQGRRGPILEARREPGYSLAAVWLQPLDGADALRGEVRFLRAAARRAAVHHEGLARVLDYGTHAGFGFLVTERPGSRLAEVLDDGGLDPGPAMRIGLELAAGLGRLHEAELVHGAVDPDNVWLTFDEAGQPTAVLFDDGLEPATPAAVAEDLQGLGALLRGLGPVLPLALGGLVERLEAGEIGAEACARQLRAWLAATPAPLHRSAEPVAPPSLSDWRWVFGSVTLALVALVAVGIGAVEIVQSLLVGAPAAEVSEVRRFVGATVADAVTVDGVGFSSDEAQRTLRFVNQASRDALVAAGIHPRVARRILAARPFDTLERFGSTPGIGVKSVAAARSATR